MNKIELRNVTKRFKSTTALDNVSLSFEEGKIYGLLGRNGAGKSTMLNAITNKIFPDSGEVFIDGEKAVENDFAQCKVHMMSDKMLYPEAFKVKDVFKYSKIFYGSFDEELAVKLTELFGLDISKKVTKLSTGYKSIFKIIATLCTNKVPYIIFDEPILGLDANHRELFYKVLVENFINNPRTIIVSTHLIEEISKIINHIVVIKEGKIIVDKDSQEFLSGGYSVTGPAKIAEEYTKNLQVIGQDSLGGLKSIYVLGAPDKAGLPANLEISALDMQKLFIQLTD